jgi:peptide/nickel transport system substrate-binding protein
MQPSSLSSVTQTQGRFGRLINRIESRRPSDRLLLRILFFAIIASFVYAVLQVNASYLAPTAVGGGTLTEGIVGIPRFVNPVLAVTRADQDMSSLIYAGLMKIDAAGTLVTDVAESITVSDDGRTYNIIVRKDVRFHDDSPLTAKDVAFTIGLLQNPDLKSPLRGNWAGVTVEEIDEYELNVVLDEAYTPFIENFTIGIMPRHIWSELPIEQVPFSQRNTEPVGAGPFEITKTNRNDAGLIESYELARARADVKLDGIVVKFYQNEQALIEAWDKGELTSTANLPLANVKAAAATDTYEVVSVPLPRVFAIFLNQNKSLALRDASVRNALEAALDRQAIVGEALLGYGVPTTSPMPPRVNSVKSNEVEDSAVATSTLVAELLSKAGWQKNANNNWEKRIDGTAVVLSVTLRTANTPLFERTTDLIAEAWRNNGILVEVEQYEQSDLLQAVIRPRDFEALLFGVDMNRTVDLYPFWHSSQREDPGLNIAQYANIEVDALVKTARTTRDSTEQATAIEKAVATIGSEKPAIFLYVPELTYVIREGVTMSPFTAISKPHERFMNIDDWHLAEEQRWPLFR